MPDKIAITFDEKNKPTTKGGTFYVTINGEKTSKRYRWCIYKKGNGNPFINEIKEDKKPLEPMKFGSFGKDGGTFIIKIYDAEKVKGKENSELSKFSEEASLEIEIKKEEEKPTTRHNIKPEILEVHLIKKGTGSITKVSYQDTLIAIAKTQGLEGKKITFNLYERDEKDRTHVKDFLAEVDRYGMARVEIPLLSNKKVFQLLANQKAPENGEGNKHEFFVTASFGLNKNMIIKDSNEVQAHLKKNIKNAYFVDANGKKVNKLQVGDSVRVCIESEDMIGTLVRYTILEKDVIKDDVIWLRKLVINDDVHTDSEITITENLFKKGIDFFGIDSDSERQNYYIKVEAYADKKESSTFELSFESVVYDVGISPVKVTVDDGKKKEDEEKKCLKKGDKNELIRELNIRLAGFGGNIPTDEFTERTESMVKQFQRDYMKVTETGIVCEEVLKSVDEFSAKFDINDVVWGQLKCSCSTKGKEVTSLLRKIKEKNKCNGFGDGTGENISNEKVNKYEYPGIHRSLLFGFKALLFYLSEQDTYSFALISSGYRCRFKNYTTTNHQGKAIDIQFKKNNIMISGKNYKNIESLEDIRKLFFEKYLKAETSWKKKNNFSLEPIGLNKNNTEIKGHTYSWIHIDVRRFEKEYLDDIYFCKERKTLNGKLMVEIAKELKLNL
ncbi:peptidoglycan-binding protein [Capnocytophaga sp. oral taxon 338]|uniref:peptidoglycan-binding domain-containing protein n=1 Tax=Capnocytophaga sp. oral taxon 338 TaxID=710239 RepID=UPI000202BFFF|nr:peptidoglycan-binding domain-containing protein [Capnocytophaga sp. oral taxon 338]EGD34030.1 hypothetical protein HMPREF9071_1410 [Capnocytophaga sp. oral taxon 338 str. F0234]